MSGQLDLFEECLCKAHRGRFMALCSPPGQGFSIFWKGVFVAGPFDELCDATRALDELRPLASECSRRWELAA